ncbi:glycosyltransferase [bacterium]|nr:glycosyltransferase [bacterium]
MNILFPYMARWKAANWTRYHHLLTRIAEKGHNVHVFQPPPMKSEETNFQEIKVELPKNLYLHDLHIPNFVWSKKYPFDKLLKKGSYSLINNTAIIKAIDKYDIDFLLLYNIPQYRLSKIKSCVKIFDFADDYIAMLDHELHKYSNNQILKFANYLLKKMMANVDLTLVISDVLAENVDGKSFILPNGVCLDDAIIGIGKEYRTSYKHPIIGFIGSFEYFIDFDLIIESAEILKDKTFLLVGGGREFNSVERKIKEKKLDNIILVGAKPHNEVLKYIDSMDICLNIFHRIPISHGACPIKLFEYMAFKKPVISSRIEEVQRIDKGFLEFADNPAELVDCVNRILNNPENSNQKNEIGYNLIKEKYTWDKIADRFLNILQDCKTTD